METTDRCAKIMVFKYSPEHMYGQAKFPQSRIFNGSAMYLHKRFFAIFHLLRSSGCGSSPQSGFEMEVFTFLLWSYDANHLSALQADWLNFQANRFVWKKVNLGACKKLKSTCRKLHIIEK